jgi:DNA-binding SARP family transcriptional activator/predicted ATPase
MHTGLSAKMFGGFEMFCDGKRLADLAYSKARAVAAYLLLEPPIPHQREVLASLLWPDQPESDARHNLRQALTTLRRITGKRRAAPPWFRATRSTVQRHADAGVATDVAEFDACLEGPVESIPNIGGLARAVKLYRGELLQGLALRGSDSAEDWLADMRGQYHRKVVGALWRLARHCEESGSWEEAAEYDRRLVSLDPWCEEAHRHLMLMLARAGHRSSALKHYEDCRARLRKELGAEPEPQTARLHRQIRQMSAARFNVPRPATPFIGRESEVEWLRRALAHPSRRLITITGLGGIGKTRLAVEAGNRAAADSSRPFLHGAVFVPLTGVQGLEPLISSVSQATGLMPSGNARLRPQLLDHLREKELLLILDDFESLISREPLQFLGALLDATSAVKILVTSRARLNFHGEQLLPLSGLPVPSESRFARRRQPGSEGTAVHLFIEAMKRFRPGFVPRSVEVQSVIGISRSLEGMPLALELAAGLAETVPLEELHREIQGNLSLLESDSVNIPDRHRSLRAVFETSRQRLTPDEGRILARLSVFRGGFTRHAAREITGADGRLLAALVSQSLVHLDESRDRYRLHELLRQFLAERLDPEESARTLDAHAAFFSKWLGVIESGLRGDRGGTALREIDREFSNVRLAWHHMAERQSVRGIGRMAGALHQFLNRRTRFEEGAAIFGAATAALCRCRGRVAAGVIARVHIFEGALLGACGRAVEARSRLREGLRFLRGRAAAGGGFHAEVALALHSLALMTDDARRARRLHEQSLAHYRAAGDSSQSASVLAALGLLWKSIGDLERAERCFRQGLATRRRASDASQAAELFASLGQLRLRQGRFKESRRLLNDGLKFARAAEDRAREIGALMALSTAHFYEGRFPQAVSALRRALRLQENWGRLSVFPETVAMLAWALIHLDRIAEAQRLAKRTLEESAPPPTRPQSSMLLSVLGAASLREQDPHRARDILTAAVGDFGAGWQVDWRARGSVLRAIVACAECHCGDIRAARLRLADALETALEVRSLIAILHILPILALLALRQGRVRRAVRLHALAQTQDFVSKSKWFDRVVGAPFAESRRSRRINSVDDPRPTVAVDKLWRCARCWQADLA